MTAWVRGMLPQPGSAMGLQDGTSREHSAHPAFVTCFIIIIIIITITITTYYYYVLLLLLLLCIIIVTIIINITIIIIIIIIITIIIIIIIITMITIIMTCLRQAPRLAPAERGDGCPAASGPQCMICT